MIPGLGRRDTRGLSYRIKPGTISLMIPDLEFPGLTCSTGRMENDPDLPQFETIYRAVAGRYPINTIRKDDPRTGDARVHAGYPTDRK